MLTPTLNRLARLTALSCLLVCPRLTAQDRFGAAVAVGTDGEVFVLKSSAARGPAAVYVYRATAGAWSLAAQLHPSGGAASGEPFGRTMSLSRTGLLVASGDADAHWGAYAYDPTDGRWGTEDTHEGGGGGGDGPAQALPLEAADAGSAGDGGGARQLDLAGIMRILRPPRRVVAGHGDEAAVALVGPSVTPTARGVHLYRRASAGWEAAGLVVPSDSAAPDASFGSSLVMGEGLLAVGVPATGNGGTVVLFDRGKEGWRQSEVLEPKDSAAAAFGSALLLDGATLLVGAPGAEESPGVVLVYARGADGSWELGQALEPSDTTTGQRFGAALAVAGDELWVGAPRAVAVAGAGAGAGTAHGETAADRIGSVYRFTRTGSLWRAAGILTVSNLAPGSSFGSSLALSRGVGVVGAPGADGGNGRVAVFSRTGAGAWDGPALLDSGLDLEAVTGARAGVGAAAAEVRCEGGTAGRFSCESVDLEAYLPISLLGGEPGERVSDLWGWSDPETGREYALVGRTGGLAIVDITEPAAPTYLGVVQANRSGARDIKVYRDYAFFTGDGAGDHGLVVFNLTRLRTVSDPPVDFEPDARYTEIGSAHNLIIDTTSGYAFPVGASGEGRTCGGGLHMVDIRDPLNPTFAGCYTDTEGLIWAGRTHDGQCVVYHGPDRDYQGREICFASNETALRIVDVTDKEHPVPLAAGSYPGRAYIHQGWLTEDQRYFYMDDELDELIGLADHTRTIIWDVADLDDPVVVGEYLGPTRATDHNLYIKGDRMYQADYRAGLRVVDISDRENPHEVGYFDTTPYPGNPPGFSGAWTAYPYFASGTVIISSIHEGLFVLRPREPKPVP